MKSIIGSDGINIKKNRYSIVTIGNFDGLHLGHMSVLKEMNERCSLTKNAITILITFSPHPHAVLPGKTEPGMLLAPEQKRQIIQSAGIDIMICLPYTATFANITAEQFITDFLVAKTGIRELFIGHSFQFGKGGHGDVSLLERFGKKHQFKVFPIKEHRFNNEIISSSRIRRAVAEGRMERAGTLLGRPYRLSGTVEKGQGRGRTLGFPTANLAGLQTIIPADGIYAVWVMLEDKRHKEVLHKGVLYIGKQPTFESTGERFVEVHIPGLQQDLYGRKMTIEIVKKIRDDKKYSSVEKLMEQIAKDVASAMALLEQHQNF